VLIDATKMRAGHGLWSWLDAVSDNDTAAIKRWHFNSDFVWLSLVVVSYNAIPTLMCIFQAERSSPHEVQPNGEAGYDIKTAAGRVFYRLADFCRTKFEFRRRQHRGFMRTDIHEIFSEFSRLVPVLWIGEKMLGKFNPYCASCTFIKPNLELAECCSGTCIKGSAATVPGPQNCPDWQHRLTLPPPTGPHCSEHVAQQVFATVNAISAATPSDNTHLGPSACMLQSGNGSRNAPVRSAPAHVQPQHAPQAHHYRTAQGHTGLIFASHPNSVGAATVEAAAPPPYTIYAHVRPAAEVTRGTTATPDAAATITESTVTTATPDVTVLDSTVTDPGTAATVCAPAAVVRRAEDETGSDRPQKARRGIKKEK
jgi:hypothetical protein